MQKKQIFTVFFLFLTFFLKVNAAADEIKIISRKDWWADETLRYLSSPEWKNIIQKNEEDALKPLTEAQKEAKLKEEQRQKEIGTYFEKNFLDDISWVQTIQYENAEKLAWPIKKTNRVKAIVIHHTDTNYSDDITSLQKIYRFHAISRWWGDIGYNFLIWKEGDIYEWRAGWDYAVWAHALYNNASTVSVSIIWEYDSKWINEKQYAALTKMVAYLAKKYGIDLNQKVYFHKDCKGKNCTNPVESFTMYPIVWHRDIWYTTCPGDELYSQIQQTLKENQEKTKWFSYITYSQVHKNTLVTTLKSSKKILESYKKILSGKTYFELVDLLWKTEATLFYGKQSANKESLNVLQTLLIEILRKQEIVWEKNKAYDDSHKIRIKLSYPENNMITLKDGKKQYSIMATGSTLDVWWKTFSKLDLSSKTQWYVEITSWKRQYDWDKEKKYNDNKFRGTLTLTAIDGKIHVINTLSITDYLKWLWEVSSGDEKEKIKTILIAARTYARFYTQIDKKYPWQGYDGTDNPDEFQRYLGYEYEKRSPEVAKIVDSTKDIVITYKDNIVKPWYFHSSDGVTKSYLQYCQEKWVKKEVCFRESLKYPFLKAQKDIGSVGLSFSWHWVGISWEGATYLAKKWWTANVIISYYLKWTSVKIKNF